jgi:hypothetical protein
MKDEHRIIVWGPGGLGGVARWEVNRLEPLDLVGIRAFSPDKIGKDAGELIGVEPVGVTATDDVAALLALEADATGIDPDLISDRVLMGMTGICTDINRIRLRELWDCYAVHAELLAVVGLGGPVEAAQASPIGPAIVGPSELPDVVAENEYWVAEIEGTPSIRMPIDMPTALASQPARTHDFGTLQSSPGYPGTIAPCLQAIPHVVESAPGVLGSFGPGLTWRQDLRSTTVGAH